MSKYVRQQTDSSCGPIAILNAIKWSVPETSATYKELYPTITSWCKCDRDGTAAIDFEKALRAMGEFRGEFTVVKVRTFDEERIWKHLRNDGGLILGHWEIPQGGVSDPEGHYSFWTIGDDDNTAFGVNAMRKPSSTVNAFVYGVFQFIESFTIGFQHQGMEIYLITRDEG